MGMWKVTPTDLWEKNKKFYDKKHPRELAAVLNNLNRYLMLLNCSPNASAARAGYLHDEPLGVVAIDQKAGGQGLQETRMYVYPDSASRMLYLITIGNKAEQSDDIKIAKKFVEDHFPKPQPTTPREA